MLEPNIKMFMATKELIPKSAKNSNYYTQTSTTAIPLHVLTFSSVQPLKLWPILNS